MERAVAVYPLGLGDVEKFRDEYLGPPSESYPATRGIHVAPLDIDEYP